MKKGTEERVKVLEDRIKVLEDRFNSLARGKLEAIIDKKVRTILREESPPLQTGPAKSRVDQIAEDQKKKDKRDQRNSLQDTIDTLGRTRQFECSDPRTREHNKEDHPKDWKKVQEKRAKLRKLKDELEGE